MPPQEQLTATKDAQNPKVDYQRALDHLFSAAAGLIL
jgi:hypothetical protein